MWRSASELSRLTVGQGGTGGPPLMPGTVGSDSTVSGPGGQILASANGGAGGGFAFPPVPTPGGNGDCPTGGLPYQGAAGQRYAFENPGPNAGQGGSPGVNGIVPAPPGVSLGGDGARETPAVPATNGANGYVLIWW